MELSGWNCPDMAWRRTIQGGIVQLEESGWNYPYLAGEELSWEEQFGWNSLGWNSGVELSGVEMSGNPVTLFLLGFFSNISVNYQCSWSDCLKCQ